MKFKIKAKLLILFLVFFNLKIIGEEHKEDQKFITIGTAPISGLFYPIGINFSKYIKERGYSSSVRSTGGTGDNIRLLLNREIELAITMQDSVVQAYKGIEAYKNKKPAKNFRSLVGLHYNYVQIITKKDSKIKTFEDLKNKKVGLGMYNSGVELNARLIYNSHKMKYSDTNVVYGAPEELVEQFKKGILDAIFLTNGIPNPVIVKLQKEMDISFISLEKDKIKKLINEYPYFHKAIINKDIYSLKKNVSTVKVKNIIICDEKLSNEIVYDLTKSIFINIEDLKLENDILIKKNFLENDFQNIQIPLHEGAIKYYKEIEILK